ncbi:DsbA family oxidoreductase [Paenibacillus sp. Marseille-P2973]|uniref:DsbA family oxidoreductase n=1 Tax=Paenibacillus sp. Marseille-P2973 TaxID=1871032 RepID=UPI001B3821BD|nr:DsbA family oxidoreductase [Paenibacillus sp. Marseille-P2973]MBQ4900979.1 DsbA family oxidoreductase [Paenibacillus sp. Marseille-P2973]
MKVEIWSDYACPFCYIGKRRFEKALEQFPHKDEVEVVFRSFELDPSSPKEIRTSMQEILAAKYGMSLDEAKAANDRVAGQASEEGLVYRFDTMIPTNTFDAHRLTHYAGEQGKMAEMSERIFKAYFTDSLHIGDMDTLIFLAQGIGLDGKETADILASDAFADEVRRDERLAGEIGVRGVPFFVLDEKYAVSGAQPLEVFQKALQQVWEKRTEQQD